MPLSNVEWPASSIRRSVACRPHASASLVRRCGRAYHIVPALYDMRREVPYHADIGHDMVCRHETVIDEVMRLKPRHAQRRPAGDTSGAGTKR